MTNIYFSCPATIFENYNLKQEFSLVDNGVCFPVCMKVHEFSRKLIVFLPGAFNRETQNEVKFQRSSYFNEVNESCICVFDPTLFLNDKIGIGWFQGELDKDYLIGFSALINNALTNLGIKSSDLIFFSTSAGGIPAIRLAQKFKGSVVYAGNIQTDFLKYYKGARNKIIEFSYDGMSAEEINEKYCQKSNILDVDADFKLILTQNKADSFHYENHFKPFLSKVSEKKLIDLELYEYVDEARGHSPLPKNIELEIIRELIENRSVKKIALDIGLTLL